MKILLIFITVAAGVGSALESGSNSMLQKTLSSLLWSVALVAVVSVVVGLLLAALFGGPLPSGKLEEAPWWAWLGGLFGVLFLFATVYVSPKLGAGPFVATIVTSSTFMSLAMDNFGLMGFEVHKAGVGRIIGGLLMAAGVACVAAF
ncbi:DMT family transporter [Lichenicoccus sp.]|uniref:DMT family transporter n=1 Tax=Lichenicoccus sp. TaxID=2781899 RepID=UPI003D14B606